MVLKTIVFIIFSFSIVTNAQTEIAKYAGEFLSLGAGGRALGMGSAFSAAVNDVSAGYWNPAGLAHINYPQAALMHEEHFGDLVNYNYGAVAVPFSTDYTFAISVFRIGVDGIPDTREALVDGVTREVIYDITDPRAQIDPSRIKDVSYSDLFAYLSFAKIHNDNFYYGASFKIIKKDLAEVSAFGLGIDIGAYYSPYENFKLAAVAKDLTTTFISWDTGRNELIAPSLRLGSAYSIETFLGIITPALDFDVRFEGRESASTFSLGGISFDMLTGIEINYKNLFAIRGGYNDVKQFTMGAGIILPKLLIDYSFARFNDEEIDRLPDTHRISLILTLEELEYLRDGK